VAKLSSLKIDHEKVNKGVLCEFADGVKFLIARKPNDAFEEFMHKEIEPHLASIRAGVFDNELDKQITKKAYAHTVLLGWEGLEDDKGNPVEYSPEKAFEILNDPDYEDIYRFVVIMSNSQNLYRKKEEASASKN